jgi:hypothetical protein
MHEKRITPWLTLQRTTKWLNPLVPADRSPWAKSSQEGKSLWNHPPKVSGSSEQPPLRLIMNPGYQKKTRNRPQKKLAQIKPDRRFKEPDQNHQTDACTCL